MEGVDRRNVKKEENKWWEMRGGRKEEKSECILKISFIQEKGVGDTTSWWGKNLSQKDRYMKKIYIYTSVNQSREREGQHDKTSCRTFIAARRKQNAEPLDQTKKYGKGK